MKKNNVFFILLIAFLWFNPLIELFALQVKGPLLIIGAGDEESSKLSSNYKVQEIYKIWDVKIANEKIFVVEFSSSQIFAFDFKGNLLWKEGGFGGGRNEFNNPREIESVDSNIWVADSGNSRIQVFSDKGYMKTIKNGNTVWPGSIAVSGQHVLVAPLSLAERSISVLDKSGNYKFSIPFKSKIIPKNSVGPFYSNRILALLGNRVFIGFNMYPIVAIIEKDLKTIKEYDLSDHYSIHSVKRGLLTLPESFAAMSFSDGPGNSILIAACDKKELKCSRVIQFSQDFKKIGEWDPGFSVRRMSYYPRKNLLAVVSVDWEVMLYEVH